jgi:predicted DNA-binding protein (UPF0251 family)
MTVAFPVTRPPSYDGLRDVHVTSLVLLNHRILVKGSPYTEHVMVTVDSLEAVRLVTCETVNTRGEATKKIKNS